MALFERQVIARTARRRRSSTFDEVPGEASRKADIPGAPTCV
jgi:hypothetical protein